MKHIIVYIHYIRLVIKQAFAIEIHVAGAMYKVFLPKITNINTHNPLLSIATISEFVLLANRGMNPNFDFLIVASKLLIPKLAYIELALHRHG